MGVNDRKDNSEDYRDRYNYPGRTRDLVIWIVVTVATLALLGAYVISSVFKIDIVAQRIIPQIQVDGVLDLLILCKVCICLLRFAGHSG